MATLHSAQAPHRSDVHGPQRFRSYILMDDLIIVEPALGMRPWISRTAAECSIARLLGPAAVNQEKKAQEKEKRAKVRKYMSSRRAREEAKSRAEAQKAKEALQQAEERETFGETLYDLLNVTRDADPLAIRAGYRRAAASCHPDADPSPEAAVRFGRVKAAYALLGDPAQKRAYDAELFLDKDVVPFARGGEEFLDWRQD